MAVAPRHEAGPVAARTRHDQTARTVHGVSVPSPPVTFRGLGPFVTAARGSVSRFSVRFT